MLKDSDPKISVIVITYNHEKYISECIESLINQTLPPFEIIVVDDFSTDNTREILNSWQTKYPERINVVKNSVNLGIGLTAVKEMKSSKGELISWLEGDDFWLPNKLEDEWIALKKNTEAKIAYSNVFIVNTRSEKQLVWQNENDVNIPVGDVFVEVFSRRFFLNANSVFRNFLIYKSSLNEIGYRDPSLESYWDWDWKIRLTSRFKVCYSGQTSVAYRRHNEGFSVKNPELHLRAMCKIYEKHKKLLEKRSAAEQLKIKLNLELVIHDKLKLLKSITSKQNYLAYEILERNYKLLSKLSYLEYQSIRKELNIILKRLTYYAIYEQIIYCKSVNVFTKIFKIIYKSISIYILLNFIKPFKK